MLDNFNRIVRPEGKVFYGWWIVLSGGGIQLLSSVLWMQSYGAYVVLLQDEFGWSKTLVAGAFALTRIESGILGPLQGWMVDRYGPRLVLQIGTVLFGLGFMLFSQVESVLTFYLSFALIAVGSSLGGFATVIVAIVSWFSVHRSKALAAAQLGFSIGGLSVPIVVLALEGFGWRTTAFVSGLIVLAIGLPLAQVIRHRPQSYGEVVDGIRDRTEDVSADGVHRQRMVQRDLSAREAMRTRSFWLISIGHALALLTVASLMVHLIPHLTTGPMAFTLAAAGGVVALMTAAQISGQVASGYFGDRFNKRFICAGCLIGHGAGLSLIALASSPWVAMTAVLIHGFAWGLRGPLMTAMRADYFGVSSFGTIMGFSSLIVMLGMSTGPIFAGWMADLSGNYQSGFLILAAGSAIGCGCFLAATPPRRPAHGE